MQTMARQVDAFCNEIEYFLKMSLFQVILNITKIPLEPRTMGKSWSLEETGFDELEPLCWPPGSTGAAEEFRVHVRVCMCVCACAHVRKHVHGCTHHMHVHSSPLMWWFIEHSCEWNCSSGPMSCSLQASKLPLCQSSPPSLTPLSGSSGSEDRLWGSSFFPYVQYYYSFYNPHGIGLTNKPMLTPTSLAGQTRISFSKWIDDISKNMLTNPFPVWERFPDCRQIHWGV